MDNATPKYKATIVALGVYLLCFGLVFLGTACPPTPPTPPACTADADCAAGEVCNLATGVCEAAPPAGCTSDADCAASEVCNLDTGECEPAPTGCTSEEDCDEGYFCDLATGDCVENVNLYATTRFDTDKDAVHMTPSGHANCTVCHHAANDDAGIPNAAGQGCVPCHNDDPNETNSFKSVAHDLNESGDGCYMCHAAEFADNCKFCHPLLP